MRRFNISESRVRRAFRRSLMEAFNPDQFDAREAALRQLVGIYRSLGNVDAQTRAAFERLYNLIENSNATPAGNQTGDINNNGAAEADRTRSLNGEIAFDDDDDEEGPSYDGQSYRDGNGYTITRGAFRRTTDEDGSISYVMSDAMEDQFFGHQPQMTANGTTPRNFQNDERQVSLFNRVRDELASGSAAFEYIKSDGSHRKAVGTTDRGLIQFLGGDSQAPAPTTYRNGHNIPTLQYWDYTKRDWRQFYPNRLIALY